MANKKADFKLDDMKEINKQANVQNCWFDDKEGLFHCLMLDGSEWTSPTGSAKDLWTRIPKKATVQDVTMDEVQGNLMAHMLSDTNPWGEDTPTQGKIKETLKGMTDLLLYKNQKYGDSALKPLGIFTKHIKNSNESTASILVRLDDKLSRVKNADSLRTNDVADILGYCTLLLISMGVTREDLEKFMD